MLLNLKSDNIFHIIDQRKVSRVLLLIGHWSVTWNYAYSFFNIIPTPIHPIPFSSKPLFSRFPETTS